MPAPSLDLLHGRIAAFCKQNGIRRLALFLMAAIAVGSSCHKPCADELSVGGKYRVSVLEPYDAQSNYKYYESELAGCGAATLAPNTCGSFDGVQGGASIGLQILANTGAAAANASCDYLNAGIIEAPPEIVFSDSSSNWGGRGSFGARLSVTVSECEGTWNLCFQKISRDSVLQAPQAGELPTVIMQRDFSTTGGTGCPGADAQSCFDVFVVQMTKI